MAKKKSFHTVSNIGSQAEDGKALKRRKTHSYRSSMSSITESPRAGRFGERIVRSVSNPYKPLALKPEYSALPGSKTLKYATTDSGRKQTKYTSNAASKKASTIATTKKAAKEKAKSEKKYARTTAKAARKANSATKKAAKKTAKVANKKAKVAKKVAKITKRTARKVNRIGRK